MIIVLCLSLCACLFPQQAVSQQASERLSVVIIDFEALGLTDSEVQEYTDFLTTELAAAQEYTFIGRRRRDAMLLENGLADLDHSDEAQRLTVGKAVGADRIITGRLKRDDGSYLLSVWIVDVATTGAVYLGEYRYTNLSALYEDSATLSQNIVAVLALEAGKGELSDRVEKKPGEDSTASEFSRTTLRSEIQQLVSKDNPAALAIQNEDLKIYFSQSGSWLGRDVSGDVHTAETVSAESSLGMEIPLNDRLGLACSCDFLFDEAEIEASYTFDYTGGLYTHFQPRLYDLGARVGLGYRASHRVSLGTALSIQNQWNEQNNGSTSAASDSFPFYEIQAGVLIEDPRERYILDFFASYTNRNEYYLDETLSSVEINYNIFSLAGSLAWEMLCPVYLTVNLAGDIFLAHRRGHEFTAVAVLHPWIFVSWRMRAGYIYSHQYSSDGFEIGHGFLAGFSLFEEDVDGFRLDLDYVRKPRFLPIHPGQPVIEHFIYLGVAFGIIL